MAGIRGRDSRSIRCVTPPFMRAGPTRGRGNPPFRGVWDGFGAIRVDSARFAQPNSETPGTSHSDTPASALPIAVAASTSLG